MGLWMIDHTQFLGLFEGPSFTVLFLSLLFSSPRRCPELVEKYFTSEKK